MLIGGRSGFGLMENSGSSGYKALVVMMTREVSRVDKAK